MADAVHYAATNPATHADASGFSGFPFQIPAGSNANNPVPLSVPDDVARWWWRIKNWSLTSTWSATNGTDTATFTNGTLDNSTNATTELELAQDAGGIRNHVFTFTATANSGGALNLFTVAGATPCFLNAGVYNPAAGLYGVSAGSFNTTLFATGAGAFTVTLTFNPADLAIVTGSFTATIDGNPVTCYYDATTSAPSSYTVGTLDFTPDEYWPFAAADGSPIWDVSTGAQLQNPRN